MGTGYNTNPCIKLDHLCYNNAKLSEVNLSAFIYRLFHKYFFSIVATNIA